MLNSKFLPKWSQSSPYSKISSDSRSSSINNNDDSENTSLNPGLPPRHYGSASTHNAVSNDIEDISNSDLAGAIKSHKFGSLQEVCKAIDEALISNENSILTAPGLFGKEISDTAKKLVLAYYISSIKYPNGFEFTCFKEEIVKYGSGKLQNSFTENSFDFKLLKSKAQNLHSAVKDNNVNKVEKILKEYPELTNVMIERKHSEWLPLTHHIFTGNDIPSKKQVEIFKILIQHGVVVHFIQEIIYRDDQQDYPLMTLLLNKTRESPTYFKNSVTLLMAGESEGDMQILREIISHTKGLNPNVPNRKGPFMRLPLHFWLSKIDKKDPNIQAHIKALLKVTGINPNIQDVGTGNTALHIAKDEFLELLIDVPNIDPNIKNNEGKTPFHSQFNESDMEKLIKIESLDPNIKDNDGNTLLHCLLFRHQNIQLDRMNTMLLKDNIIKINKIAKNLLDRGADLNTENNDGYTALHCAISVGLVETVKEFLESEKVTTENVKKGLEMIKKILEDIITESLHPELKLKYTNNFNEILKLLEAHVGKL
jgi:ankyrin repeat protein